MKTSRKLVVALTLAAMIATMVGTGVVSAAPTAQAAAFSDISGNDYEVAIDWIAALGIVGGRPGGVYDPTANITREEMAKVVINFIGRGDLAAQLSANGPSFKDANQISDWAVGYVNAAAALGIINGYPDGTFKPKNKVLFQEVVTMLIRAIGDEPYAKAIGSVYPANYLSAGALLNVTKGFTTATAALPATRGEVAQLVYNAGTAPRYKAVFDSQGHYVLPGAGDKLQAPEDTMFNSVTNLGEYEVDTSGALVTAVSGSTIYFSTGGRALADKVTLLGASSFSDLLNHNVNFAADSSGKITLIEVPSGPSGNATISGTLNTAASAIPSGFVADSVYSVNWYLVGTGANSSKHFVLLADGTLVQLTSGVTFEKNGSGSNPGAIGNNAYNAVITLDANSQGTDVAAWALDQANAWVGTKPTAAWSSTNGATFSVNYTTGSPPSGVSSGTIKFDPNQTSVTWNGVSMTPADAYAKIQSDVAAGIYPVLQIAGDGNGSLGSPEVAKVVTITDTQVSGKLTNVTISSAGASVTIGSTTALVASGSYANVDSATSPSTANAGFPSINSDVVASLVGGKVQFIFGAAPVLAASQTYIANITGVSYNSATGDYEVTFDQAGKTYTLPLDAAPGAGFPVGYVILTTDNTGNQVQESTVIALSTDVQNGDTLQISGLTISGGTVQSITFDDVDTNTSGVKTITGPGDKWAVYDAEGHYLGDSALSVGAQFTVISDTGDNYFVLIKQ